MFRIPEPPRIFCNSCDRETTHYELSNGQIKEKQKPIQTISRTYEVLQCLDCMHVVFRIQNHEILKEMTGDPYVKIVETYPSPHFRIKPSWYKKINRKFRSILDEVYRALDESLFFIASTGVRTALDILIVENVGDEGSFKEKTELLVKKKIIDFKEKELLDVLINAGSASAHRGFRPNRITMKNMIEITEKIFYNICIAPKERAEVMKKAKKLSNKIPQRTKSKSKTKSQPQA